MCRLLYISFPKWFLLYNLASFNYPLFLYSFSSLNLIISDYIGVTSWWALGEPVGVAVNSHTHSVRVVAVVFCYLFNRSMSNWYPELLSHDDVIKWKYFPRYWPFERGIHRSPVNSPHKGQWRGALMFSLICTWINGRVNNREAGDLRRHRAHYDVSVIYSPLSQFLMSFLISLFFLVIISVLLRHNNSEYYWMFISKALPFKIRI